MKQIKQYCCLDIETSGFDPLKCEVLEVGFVFFTLESGRVEITEEWTSVFKPFGEVSPGILALTGISPQELNQAPSFAEHHEFLQDKLGNADIVGHNIGFDVKFLESFGLKFSGALIDTLDLAQIILPTHHSYNLENLMHTFNVSHKDAHRALADSKATLVVLEKLLRLYNSFPVDLRNKAGDLALRAGFPWAHFLQAPLLPLKIEREAAIAFPLLAIGEKGLENRVVYDFPSGFDPLASITAHLTEGFKKNRYLLVLPSMQKAKEYWRLGVVGVLFAEEQRFNEKKYASFIEKKNLSPEEAKFALKIMVWKYTNWQTESVFDLNLAFFGAQFKTQITGAGLKERISSPLACCDMQTFLALSRRGCYTDRHVVIFGLNEFEQQISSGISTKVSWSHISYLIKSVYNPELDSGTKKMKKTAAEALAATDLFFGLASALLQSDPPSFQYVPVSERDEYRPEMVKIKKAAESYAEKLEGFAKMLEKEELLKVARDLLSFFSNQDKDRVRWIEMSENRCIFYSNPLDITGLVREALGPYEKVAFADSLGTQGAFGYFLKRLGINDYAKIPVSQYHDGKKTSNKIGQRDLFSVSVRQPSKANEVKNKILCHIRAENVSEKDLFGILSANPFPAALILASQVQVKQFHDSYFRELGEKASLFFQASSGGSNKILRNFSINEESLLVATDKFVLKHLGYYGQVDPVFSLPVKTLVLCHIPFEQFTHPYQQALSSRYANPFEDFSIPKALYNFHCLVNFFNTSRLETIYVCDPKLAKGYAKYFVDYLANVPGLAFAEQKEKATFLP